MIPEGEEDLVHGKRGADGLDEHAHADRACGEAELGFGPLEHVVPELGVGGTFELRQVEVRPGAAATAAAALVATQTPKSKSERSDRLTVDREVRLSRCHPRVRTMSVAWSGFGIRISPPISAVRVPA